MVSTKPEVNGAEGGIPPGKYHVVGWDLDTTGRRLIDEICQIAAFSPASKFSQYVMPHRDISLGAQRRHNIRVVTIGRYRMLKDSKTGKILKTKSEISALTDFLQWLEDLRGSNLDGIILLNHENFRVIAPMLLESLRRYNLLDRFSAVVKGFVNGYKVAEAKCAESVRFFPLRTLSRILLDKDPILDNAEDRAELIYEIAHRLCVEDEKPDETNGGDGDCAAGDTNLILGKAICKFGVTLEVEEKAIEEIKLVLDRQKNLTPVFASQLRATLRQRQRATVLRRLLAAEGVELATLAKSYTENGSAGIDNVLATLSSAKPKDIIDLKDILLGYFDPTYKPSQDTTPRNVRPRKPRKGSLTETNPNAAKTKSSPDASSKSTGAHSEDGSPSKVQNATEQSVLKVEPETPKPPRSEAVLNTVKQDVKSEVSTKELSEIKPTVPGVQLASQESNKSVTPAPESKPSLSESKPTVPESETSTLESKPSSLESEPSSPELHSLESTTTCTEPPKISSVSSDPLQQAPSTPESEVVQEELATTNSPAS
ncbi:maternal protein exuperantia isoform X2 [Bacillus rossius redtenbacheri]